MATQVNVRLPDETLVRLDRYLAQQRANHPGMLISRSDAMRDLLEKGLRLEGHGQMQRTRAKLQLETRKADTFPTHAREGLRDMTEIPQIQTAAVVHHSTPIYRPEPEPQRGPTPAYTTVDPVTGARVVVPSSIPDGRPWLLKVQAREPEPEPELTARPMGSTVGRFARPRT